MAPYLVPDPLTPEVALDHVLELAGEVGGRELAQVVGAVEALVAGLCASVQQGHQGLREDVAHQLEPGLDLTGVTAPSVLPRGERRDLASGGRGLARRSGSPTRSWISRPTAATTCSSPAGGESCVPYGVMRGSEQPRRPAGLVPADWTSTD